MNVLNVITTKSKKKCIINEIFLVFSSCYKVGTALALLLPQSYSVLYKSCLLYKINY